MLSSLAEVTFLMSTDAQINANRENARSSTGPQSTEGKAKSSLNAIRTGLTGRTVLLPGDDIAAYQQHVACLEDHYKPLTGAEKLLVQSVADSEWRIGRIPSLEAGIYALGRLEFAAEFENEDPAVSATMLDAKTFLVHHRQLNNLTIQENRLRRQREKDIAGLKSIQADRIVAENALPRTTLASPEIDRHRAHLSDYLDRRTRSSEIGFDFETPITIPGFGPTKAPFGPPRDGNVQPKDRSSLSSRPQQNTDSEPEKAA